jgi:hypothetical protein
VSVHFTTYQYNPAMEARAVLDVNTNPACRLDAPHGRSACKLLRRTADKMFEQKIA